ncbi:MAG: nucleotidyl transferase AbiEii/AbiGii toxin family protein, partial [Thermodesulfobacteriota bacterium]|nr:nucleotidyl transferase AbiEii/AbiGii toxin family protein [Thermodesulfobacteriota bacterium]
EVHTEILNRTQKKILPCLAKALSGTDLYLAGGTALALQTGHRPSIDFYFFAKRIGDPEQLYRVLKSVHLDFMILSESFETVYLDIDSVQVRFIGYDYPMLQSPLVWNDYHLYLAGIDDIACMKLSAVTNRGVRKDFIDLYYIVRNFGSLEHYIDLFIKKFQQQDIGHVVRSLVFFEDADLEPDVKMNVELDWQDVKRAFESWVKKISK